MMNVARTIDAAIGDSLDPIKELYALDAFRARLSHSSLVRNAERKYSCKLISISIIIRAAASCGRGDLWPCGAR